MLSALSAVFPKWTPNKSSHTQPAPDSAAQKNAATSSAAPVDRFYRIVVAPGSKPSTEFMETIERNMQAIEQDYAGPVVELLKRKPIEFRVARTFPELFNKLKTREAILGNRGLPPILQQWLKNMREEDPDVLREDLQGKLDPFFKLAVQTVLSGDNDLKLQAAYAKNWRKSELKRPATAASYFNDRIYIAEHGRQEKLAMIRKAKKALKGVEPPEQLRRTLLGTEKHELAHHIDEVTPTEPWKELSSDPAFRECVMKDVRKLAERKLIPYKIDADGTLFFERPEEAIFPERILLAQAGSIIPESVDAVYPFGEVFSEVLSAMHGDHSKMIEELIYCTTGDENKVGNADAEAFLNQLFPHAKKHVETVILPKIAERSRQLAENG